MILLLIGFLASFIGGLVGLGGGFIIVPAVSFILGWDVKDAIFLSLCSIFILSLLYCHRNRALIKANRVSLFQFAFFSVIGSIATSLLLPQISSGALDLSFAVVMVCFGLIYLVRPSPSESEAPILLKASSVSNGAFLFSGALAGLFGIGGGIVNIPILHSLLKVDIREAAKLSFFLMFVATLVALIVHLQLRREEIEAIPVLAVLFLVIGTILGFTSAQRVKFSGLIVRRLFSILVLSVGLFKIWGQVN